MKFERPIINIFVFQKNAEEERLTRRCSLGSADLGQQREEAHFYFSGALSSILCGHFWSSTVGLGFFRQTPVFWSRIFCGSALDLMDFQWNRGPCPGQLQGMAVLGPNLMPLPAQWWWAHSSVASRACPNAWVSRLSFGFYKFQDGAHFCFFPGSSSISSSLNSKRGLQAEIPGFDKLFVVTLKKRQVSYCIKESGRSLFSSPVVCGCSCTLLSDDTVLCRVFFLPKPVF